MNSGRSWCEGGGKTATPQGACPVCGFKGKVTKYGVMFDHKERAA